LARKIPKKPEEKTPDVCSGNVKGDVSSLPGFSKSDIELVKEIAKEFNIPKLPTLADFMVKEKKQEDDINARFVAHSNYELGDIVIGKKMILKHWLVENTGTVQWPEGTYVEYVAGDKSWLFEGMDRFDVPLARPGEQVEIPAVLMTQVREKVYDSHFSLVLPNGKRFGSPLIVRLEVYPDYLE